MGILKSSHIRKSFLFVIFILSGDHGAARSQHWMEIPRPRTTVHVSRHMGGRGETDSGQNLDTSGGVLCGRTHRIG